jgi:hypothetical protein
MKSLVGFAFIIMLFYITCNACSDEDESRAQPGPDGIVLNAQAYSYSELPGTAKSKASDGFDFFNYLEHEDKTNKTLKKEDGYYVALTLDNLQLAQASTKDTNWHKLIDPNNYRALYGKYRNGPSFYNAEGKEIKGLEKGAVHELFYIARSGNFDTAYYGPMNERPVRMALGCSYLDSAHTPRLAVQ